MICRREPDGLTQVVMNLEEVIALHWIAGTAVNGLEFGLGVPLLTNRDLELIRPLTRALFEYSDEEIVCAVEEAHNDHGHKGASLREAVTDAMTVARARLAEDE